MIRIDGVDGHGLLTIDAAAKRVHDAWYTANAVNKHGRDLARCKVSIEKSKAPVPDNRSKIVISKTSKSRNSLEVGKSDRHKVCCFCSSSVKF